MHKETIVVVAFLWSGECVWQTTSAQTNTTLIKTGLFLYTNVR